MTTHFIISSEINQSLDNSVLPHSHCWKVTPKNLQLGRPSVWLISISEFIGHNLRYPGLVYRLHVISLSTPLSPGLAPNSIKVGRKFACEISIFCVRVIFLTVVLEGASASASASAGCGRLLVGTNSPQSFSQPGAGGRSCSSCPTLRTLHQSRDQATGRREQSPHSSPHLISWQNCNL